MLCCAAVDITPTFTDIAGLPPHPQHDGKSLMPLLLSEQREPSAPSAPHSTAAESAADVAAGWRTSLIIEYLSVGTCKATALRLAPLLLNELACLCLLDYNDHAKIWLAGPWGNGSLVEYGSGPFSPIEGFNESNCAASEGTGSCCERAAPRATRARPFPEPIL